MQARTLVIAGLAVAVGIRVRHSASSQAEPPPRAAVSRAEPSAPARPVAAAAAVHEPALDVAPDRDVPAFALGVDEDIPPSAIHGQIIDDAQSEPLAGVTVIATSPALEGSQTAITDENGEYLIESLPAGEYRVTFYYFQVTLEQSGIMVTADRATPIFLALDVHPIPIPGRTFEAALGEASGSQSDPPEGFSGPSSDLGDDVIVE